VFFQNPMVGAGAWIVDQPAAATAAIPSFDAYGVTSCAGYGAQADFAVVKTARILGQLAFHADREIREVRLPLKEQSLQDSKKLAAIDGAAGEAIINFYDFMQRDWCFREQVSGVTAVDLLAQGGDILMAGQQIDTTIVGAGPQRDQGFGACADLLQPAPILPAGDTPFDESDIQRTDLFRHQFPKFDHLNQLQHLEEIILQIHDSQLAAFAAGEVEKSDTGLHRSIASAMCFTVL
jgi:hypothetical protein